MAQDLQSNSQEQQLIGLRQRLKEIRLAKKWLPEYRVNAPISISNSLSAYYNWLSKQEQNTIAMGKHISKL